MFVIVRDFEQEACFIIMLWAMAIMAYKAVAARGESRQLQMAFIHLEEGESINPARAATHGKRLRTLPEAQRRKLLPRALATALGRFSATRNIQDAADTAHDLCQAESERLESELSMVRYLAWAIPSIGFIGTVRGIGEALAQAHKAVEGDIAGVTRSLGVAFNSTLVALLISIVIMFLLHQVQLQQDRLVLDTEHYLDEHLIEHLRVEHG
jgi:biopolymer transport protein ExbB/TolQ